MISTQPWGISPAGPAQLFTLTNQHGNTVRVSDYGATVTSIVVNGAELVLGYDDLAGYLGDQPYFGATIGRFGNRIAGGQFSLDGQAYQVPTNNGPNALHGGPVGFDKKLWAAKILDTPEGQRLNLQLVSEDGDQGFPGRLEVGVTFGWTDDNSLVISYVATADKPTVINLTNHSYFNLGDTPHVLEHEMGLKCTRMVPVGPNGIPTGELALVAGTPFDFTRGKLIGRDIHENHQQLLHGGGGYDHTFVLDTDDPAPLRQFAYLLDPASGRSMTAFTTEPGVQVYTANFDAGQFTGRNGQPLPPHAAVCLETQHFPDSPNQPAFPSTRLDPGGRYQTGTIYRFA